MSQNLVGDQWSPAHGLARIQCAAQVPYTGAGDTTLAKGKYLAISKPVTEAILQGAAGAAVALGVASLKHGALITTDSGASATCAITLPTIAQMLAEGFKVGDSVTCFLKIQQTNVTSCAYTLATGGEVTSFGALGNTGTAHAVAGGRFAFMLHIHIESASAVTVVSV
jgi:hypothetical protein